MNHTQLYADKYLTTDFLVGEALMCIICQFPWCKYTYHGQFKQPMWHQWTQGWEEMCTIGSHELVQQGSSLLLTVSLSNKTADKGKHLFIKCIPTYKWKRNDRTKTSPFCNLQWISGSWHWAPTVANLNLEDTTEYYMPPDERMPHHSGSCQWDQTQFCRACGSSCEFCRKCKQQGNMLNCTMNVQ